LAVWRHSQTPGIDEYPPNGSPFHISNSHRACDASRCSELEYLPHCIQAMTSKWNPQQPDDITIGLNVISQETKW
jgi:hypothetical protein